MTDQLWLTSLATTLDADCVADDPYPIEQLAETLATWQEGSLLTTSADAGIDWQIDRLVTDHNENEEDEANHVDPRFFRQERETGPDWVQVRVYWAKPPLGLGDVPQSTTELYAVIHSQQIAVRT